MRIQSLSLFFFAFLISGCGGSSSSNEGASDTSAVAKDTTKVVAAEPVAPAPNTLTDAEKSDGWQLLFDGSDTVGWHVYNHKSNGSAWKIVDGTLHLDPAKMDDWQVVGGGDIISDKEFENFDFKAEWKIADSGNSGIMFYVQEDPKYNEQFLGWLQPVTADFVQGKVVLEGRHRRSACTGSVRACRLTSKEVVTADRSSPCVALPCR